MRASPLHDLLLASFDNDIELRRFLTLIGHADVAYRLPPTKDGSIRIVALEAAEALEDSKQVDEALFEALARRSPQMSNDVWTVAAAYGVRPGGATESDPPIGFGAGRDRETMVTHEDPITIPDEYADFVRELDAELLDVGPVDQEALALQPARWPWTAAAAVLGGFAPLSLAPLPGPGAPTEPAVTALSAVVATTFDGRWVLADSVRSAALIKLAASGQLLAAAGANSTLPDEERDWIVQLYSGAGFGSWIVTQLVHLETSRLKSLGMVLRWLEPLDLDPDLDLDLDRVRAVVHSAIDRRQLIDPLRALVGKNFRGRSAESERIWRHINGLSETPILVLRGPGGVGKSSLVGSVLLQLERQLGGQPIPFAYVDFDKARHDPSSPVSLLEQIVRQLRLLFAASAEQSQTFAALEGLASDSDIGYSADLLDVDLEFGKLDLDGLVLELCKRLDQASDGRFSPLLLVFDTFEEVQMQGPGPVSAVLGLVGRFEKNLPGIRVILSGRGKISGLGLETSYEDVTLGDLDAEAADAVLEAEGVLQPALRGLIIHRFGGNPLTLRLAAEALRRLGTVDKAFEGVTEETGVLAEVAREQMQGMLYSRILGHIPDAEIARVAHPGLAVRRVDIEVIRDVLAGPCELDPRKAPDIFARLRREVSLFELDDDGGLRHRQDVRRLMMRTMMDEPARARKVADIHRLAVSYYAARDGQVARCEEIYHRLMRDEDPRLFDHRWYPKLGKSLSSALEEPLRPRARAWLERRLGRAAGQDSDQWAQDEWEIEAAAHARSWLSSKDAARALQVLSERSARTPASPIYALEVRALLLTHRVEDARAVLDRGMHSAIDAEDRSVQMELADLSLDLEVQRGDPAAIMMATTAVVRMTDLAGDRVRAIDVLCRSIDSLERIGAVDESATLATEVTRRFVAVPSVMVKDHAELARRVVQTVGPVESTVIVRAAIELGDTLRDPVFRDNSFALTRLFDQTTEAGRPRLNQLALDVGMSDTHWSTTELARSVTQSGRVGQAVILGLDFASDERNARRLVVDELVYPTSGPRLS